MILFVKKYIVFVAKKKVKHMNNHELSYYEARLQNEIEQIERKINELSQEKYALQRQLLKARRENFGLQDVNRKNSIARVMIENRIIEALKASKEPLNSDKLFNEALNANFSLKEATFRTYLHRMKNKGTIENAGRSGRWKLPLTFDKKIDFK